MYNLRASALKILLNASIIFSLLVLLYFTFMTDNDDNKGQAHRDPLGPRRNLKHDYNVWLVFTKVSPKSPLKFRFHNLLENLLNVSSVALRFHIIVDDKSRDLAIGEISDVVSSTNKPMHYKLYDAETCARVISDIVGVMTPHFSSKPGTYYSDGLFYLSLGLHRIAPSTQNTAVLLDCDLLFKDDIKLLFDEFTRFKSSALFGLAPELSPVYRHVLQKYKHRRNTTFGESYHPRNVPLALSSDMPHLRGFQGYNSGVVLLNLNNIRTSSDYPNVLKNETVRYLVDKYRFRGHLGDQDFYTLLGFEWPHLIQTVNCGFNRQLCVWWRDHGYSDVFEEYFKCRHHVVVLHGNCNTRIPK